MIVCDNLVKIYKTQETEVIALQGLDLTVEDGELMAIIGNSGSGKSTLLNMIGGLDRPSAGSLTVDGKDLLKFTPQDYIRYKRETVGFVWQNNARNLIPYMTALENIQLPMVLTRRTKAQRIERAKELLDRMGLAKRANNKLAQLSGGEQQRIAIAIALANEPKLLLADEPTGAVDTQTANHVMDIFNELNRDLGLTIVIVTHDENLRRKVDRVVSIRDGRTSAEFVRRRSYREELAEAHDLAEANLASRPIEESHDELVLVDNVGRLQLPKDYMEKLHLAGGRMRAELDENDGKITLEIYQKK